MNKRFFTLSISLMLLTTLVTAQRWDTQSDTWVAVDGLGREVANSDNCTIPLKDNRTVGIFYYLWHGAHGKDGVPVRDVTELLKLNRQSPDWGEEEECHWWGKPWLGYYVDTDPFVADKHLQMLCDAGIDFLFLEYTNAVTYDEEFETLLRAIDRREAAGLPWPRVCFMLNAAPERTLRYLWKRYYSHPDYDKYWYRHQNRPLIFADRSQLEKVDSEILNHFTIRHSWAWMQGKEPDKWAWLEYYPQAPGWTVKDGEKSIEQISVSTAQHATTKVGKSYHKGHQPPIDSLALCKETPLGLYFNEQWEEALRVDPPMVMVTQFNEGFAMRFLVKDEKSLGDTRPGVEQRVGESVFVDTYNAEFNRDIEPSTHPLIRDNYYMMLADRVRRYKGMRTIPTPSAQRSIMQNNDMTQWRAVEPEFRDDIGDITHRSTLGYNKVAPIENHTGRTDLKLAKVAQDSNNLFFYLQTANDIPDINKNENWLILLINSDCDYSTGWNGYDYAAMKRGTEYYLFRNQGGRYDWQPIGPIEINRNNRELHFALKKSDLGFNGDRDIDFKWADNIPASPDILDFLDKGDVAPNGRFNYRFKGATK